MTESSSPEIWKGAAKALIKVTEFFLKDSFEGGGFLPDKWAELARVVKAEATINQKAVKGRVKLKFADPVRLSGSTILLRGLGPRFSGLYLIEKHSIMLSRDGGFRSEFQVSSTTLGEFEAEDLDAMESEITEQVEAEPTLENEYDQEAVRERYIKLLRDQQ